MPSNVRFVSRLLANADLTGPTPPRIGKRGRPRLRGHALGKPADLAATLEWRTATVARYGEQVRVEAASVVGQWYGSWNTTPLRIVLVRRPGRKGFDIALYCTDPDAADEEVIADYAGRWPIETAFQNGKQHTGAGQARRQQPPVGEPPDQPAHRRLVVEDPLDDRRLLARPQHPTTIALIEVSIPRWINPAPDVTLDMTVGSLLCQWLRSPPGQHLPASNDPRHQPSATDRNRSRPFHADLPGTCCLVA
jgi:hypothetical protein